MAGVLLHAPLTKYQLLPHFSYLAMEMAINTISNMSASTTATNFPPLLSQLIQATPLEDHQHLFLCTDCTSTSGSAIYFNQV
jgi:hypothetical protein